MRIVLTLLVRDEEDILHHNVLYHLQMGVDAIIATDNRSVDGTLEILKGFERQGVLHVIREDEDTFAQDRWVSRMAHIATTDLGADWVINGDADEFWWPRSGTLADTLAEIPPEYDVVSAPRHNFLPCATPPRDPLRWWERMVVRHKDSRNMLGKTLVPKLCHRGIPNIAIAQGNHDIVHPASLRTYPETPIEILHFPLRRFPQFENKIAKGGAAYERNPLPSGYGDAWRELYREWKRGRLRDHYDREAWPPDRVRQGLQSGALILDERLKDFFAERTTCGFA